MIVILSITQKDMLPRSGQTINDVYEIIEPLGRGGLGVVFKAKQSGIDRIVAIKMLHSAELKNPDVLARFLREAQALRALEHKNIVRCYSYGIWLDLVPFITFEWLEGETLRQHLANQQKLPPRELISLMIELCNGLQVAHNANLVHRDLKPENIMVTSDGILKILDFGLAASLSGDFQKLTQSGFLVGTAQYLSPEQCTAQAIDQRSDIYSMGCLMYELLCGHPPFYAASPLELLRQHTTVEAPELCSIEPLVSVGLSDIVHKCLAKIPVNRYQDVKTLRDDLHAELLAMQPNSTGADLAAHAGIKQQTKSRIRRQRTSLNRTTFILAGLLLVLALLGIADPGIAGGLPALLRTFSNDFATDSLTCAEQLEKYGHPRAASALYRAAKDALIKDSSTNIEVDKILQRLSRGEAWADKASALLADAQLQSSRAHWQLAWRESRSAWEILLAHGQAHKDVTLDHICVETLLSAATMTSIDDKNSARVEARVREALRIADAARISNPASRQLAYGLLVNLDTVAKRPLPDSLPDIRNLRATTRREYVNYARYFLGLRTIILYYHNTGQAEKTRQALKETIAEFMADLSGTPKERKEIRDELKSVAEASSLDSSILNK
jgi:serine/threonine protein kinase